MSSLERTGSPGPMLSPERPPEPMRSQAQEHPRHVRGRPTVGRIRSPIARLEPELSIPRCGRALDTHRNQTKSWLGAAEGARCHARRLVVRRWRPGRRHSTCCWSRAASSDVGAAPGHPCSTWAHPTALDAADFGIWRRRSRRRRALMQGGPAAAEMLMRTSRSGGCGGRAAQATTSWRSWRTPRSASGSRHRFWRPCASSCSSRACAGRAGRSTRPCGRGRCGRQHLDRQAHAAGSLCGNVQVGRCGRYSASVCARSRMQSGHKHVHTNM